jgi:hypothetical protein
MLVSLLIKALTCLWGLSCCILLQWFRSRPFTDGTRGVSNKFRDQHDQGAQGMLRSPSIRGTLEWQIERFNRL